jgi:hypothetical protein
VLVGQKGGIARVIAAIGSVSRVAQPVFFTERVEIPLGRRWYLPGISIGDLEAGYVGPNDREWRGRSCDLEGRTQDRNAIMVGPVRVCRWATG